MVLSHLQTARGLLLRRISIPFAFKRLTSAASVPSRIQSSSSEISVNEVNFSNCGTEGWNGILR